MYRPRDRLVSILPATASCIALSTGRQWPAALVEVCVTRANGRITINVSMLSVYHEKIQLATAAARYSSGQVATRQHLPPVNQSACMSNDSCQRTQTYAPNVRPDPAPRPFFSRLAACIFNSFADDLELEQILYDTMCDVFCETFFIYKCECRWVVIVINLPWTSSSMA